MRAWLLATTLLIGSSALAAPARVALVVYLPHRLPPEAAAQLQTALEQAATELALPTAPAGLQRTLRQDAPARAARERARRQLNLALQQVEALRYPEAVRRLQTARREAIRGLAHLVEPQMLAEIEVRIGLLRHLMRAPHGDRALMRGVALWPARAHARAGQPPKVARALAQAARQARRKPLPRPPRRVMQRVASVSQADQVVVIAPVGDTDGVVLIRAWLFDARAARWQRDDKQLWPDTAGPRARRQRIVRLLRRLLGRDVAPPASLGAVSQPATGDGSRPPASPPPPARGRRPRRLATWIAAGSAVALAAAGTALFVVSHQRVEDAESRAATPPAEEYTAKAQGLESSARNLRTAAIVTSATAGAAAVTALVLWLTRPREGSAQPVRAAVTPTGVSLAVRF